MEKYSRWGKDSSWGRVMVKVKVKNNVRARVRVNKGRIRTFSGIGVAGPDTLIINLQKKS